MTAETLSSHGCWLVVLVQRCEDRSNLALYVSADYYGRDSLRHKELKLLAALLALHCGSDLCPVLILSCCFAQSVLLSVHTSAQTSETDPQTSLTLLPSLVASNFSQDGLNSSGSAPDLVSSLTSTNNFINFCATVQDKPLTSGQQLPNGSCNPAPMGVLAPQSSMPSAKFIFPQNTQRIPANQTFTIQLAVRNLNTGWATNSAANYMAAPQQLDGAGRIQGHSHVAIDRLDDDALGSTVPTDPTKMVFFKALNDKDVGGVLTTNVVGGLPSGAYRLASIQHGGEPPACTRVGRAARRSR
ncbi:hypothetical protein C8Q80DRAFT_1124847 [Daedaleopsis nitida]|nr:hypothetical protein C8Q80DRAFT_1124847 [Daedaleopsis nitida]